MENNTNVSYTLLCDYYFSLYPASHQALYCHGFTDTFLSVRQDPVVPGLSPPSM